MQAVFMVVDVLALRRVVLHAAILGVPEQVFDEAHLLPGWGAVWQGHADVFPSSSVRCDAT